MRESDASPKQAILGGFCDEVELTGAVLTGDEAVLEFVTAMVVGIAPVLTGNGIATEEEVDIGNFAEQVRADLGPDPMLVVSGPSLAVWARKP